jgi:hypothetical protein
MGNGYPLDPRQFALDPRQFGRLPVASQYNDPVQFGPIAGTVLIASQFGDHAPFNTVAGKAGLAPLLVAGVAPLRPPGWARCDSTGDGMTTVTIPYVPTADSPGGAPYGLHG